MVSYRKLILTCDFEGCLCGRRHTDADLCLSDRTESNISTCVSPVSLLLTTAWLLTGRNQSVRHERLIELHERGAAALLWHLPRRLVFAEFASIRWWEDADASGGEVAHHLMWPFSHSAWTVCELAASPALKESIGSQHLDYLSAASWVTELETRHFVKSYFCDGAEK